MVSTERIIKTHPIFTQAETLKQITRPLKKLGINYFSHAHIDKKKTLTCLSNNPDFIAVYFSKGYQHYDLHMLNKSSAESYILWDLVGIDGKSKELHQDFMSFNQGHTFSIINRNEDSVDCYHFATALKDLTINQMYLEKLDELKRFISYFKDYLSRDKELRRAYNFHIPLHHRSGEFQCAKLIIDCSKESIIEDIVHDRLYAQGFQQYLTKAEANVLFWLSQGKTLDEAATILAITPRTVKAHIGCIKEKFHCQTLFQLGMLFQKIGYSI